MKVLFHCILSLIAATSSAQELPKGRNWSLQLPELVAAHSLIFLGEKHGNLSNYETYQPLLEQNQIDTFLLEWIYDHKQHLLDAYLTDSEATPNSLKETYHLCLLARSSLFDGGPSTTPISFEKFRELFADVPAGKMIPGCDHEGSSFFLRKLHELKKRRADLKVCAIDFWDYYGDDLTIPNRRLQTFSKELQDIGNRFYGDYRKQVREIALAQNILECIAGRKKAVGILGAFHLNPIGTAGIVDSVTGKSRKTARAVQITSSITSDQALCKQGDECAFADADVQMLIKNGINKIELIPAKEWLAKFREKMDMDFRIFWNFQNFVVAQPPRAYFEHDSEMFHEVRRRLTEASER